MSRVQYECDPHSSNGLFIIGEIAGNFLLYAIIAGTIIPILIKPTFNKVPNRDFL